MRQERRTNVESPRAFWTVKFVRANRDEVGFELGDVGEPFLAEPLRGVRVKEHAALAADGADLVDPLHRADLVIHPHNRDKDRVGANCVAQ